MTLQTEPDPSPRQMSLFSEAPAKTSASRESVSGWMERAATWHSRPLRIVACLKPRWFVFENVPGLLSNWSGGPECPHEPGSSIKGHENSDFAAFLGTVDELGYFGAWASLDAQYFRVAQRRERLFFVGHSGDWRAAAAVLLEPQSLCGNYPPRREPGQTVAPTIASRPTAGGGLGTDFDLDGGLIAAFGGNNTEGPIDVATARNAHGGPHGRLDFESETFIAFDTTQITSKENRCQPQPGDPCHPIAAHGHAPAIAQTLTSHWERSKGASAGNNSGVINPIIYPSGVRRLTPRECERLQGFPDDYTLVAYRGKPAADGPRYKAIGNSMAVPVMRWILSRVEQVDQIK